MTATTMQRALISVGQSFLLPALRAERRRRNQLFLPVENRRNFFVKREIIGSDFEVCSTLMTRSFHEWNGKDGSEKRNNPTSE